MAAALTPSEEAQLAQTIEMFEVITQSQPLDYQSLEILKEAYFKLNRTVDVLGTSKRIAQAYVQLGQLSSAILEYEGILQRYPDDPDVLAALNEIESKAQTFSMSPTGSETELVYRTPEAAAKAREKLASAEVEDGRSAMYKLFVEGKLISSADFNQLWHTPSPNEPPPSVYEPFIQVLADRQLFPVDRSLKLLCERSHLPYLPLEKYDLDVELARSFPRDICRRWSVLPFDRMSKSVLLATANPFNKQVVWELEHATKSRLLWYLSPPAEIVKSIRKIYR
jgi:tetratricopeptide (TPR) repeat protein